MNAQRTGSSDTQANGSLAAQVVRGRDVGRRYPVGAGETPLGNALDGQTGLDLREQEWNSPRRMAGQHACISRRTEEITIRDLDSPGGTFVNRQRLLSGQAGS